MTLLLDTCTFLWMVLDPTKLSNRATHLVQDSANRLHLSAASAWEIAVAHGLGRLTFQMPPTQVVPTHRTLLGIDPLPLTEWDALQVVNLPPIHKDPFDRMLICQAKANSLVLLSPDHWIQQYPGIRIEW